MPAASPDSPLEAGVRGSAVMVFSAAVTRQRRRDTVETAYIVTDSAAAYQNVARALPERVTPVRLYESYLHNFQINRRD